MDNMEIQIARSLELNAAFRQALIEEGMRVAIDGPGDYYRDFIYSYCSF